MSDESTILGIDPGLGGAIAALASDGTLIGLHDVPTLQLKVARGHKQEYDVPGLVALLKPYVGNGVQVCIEEAQSMPGQGVHSTFVTGLGFGLWLGLLGALGIPYTRVRPGNWKRAMGLLKADKEASRLRAQQLYPGAALRRKKDHGRAEALLLARYGWQMRRH